MTKTDSYIYPQWQPDATAAQWLERWQYVQTTLKSTLPEWDASFLEDALFSTQKTKNLTEWRINRLTAAQWSKRWNEVRDAVLEYYHPLDAAFIVNALEYGTRIH
jgi:hypothetical protein